jgi:hypothetical protein
MGTRHCDVQQRLVGAIARCELLGVDAPPPPGSTSLAPAPVADEQHHTAVGPVHRGAGTHRRGRNGPDTDAGKALGHTGQSPRTITRSAAYRGASPQAAAQTCGWLTQGGRQQHGRVGTDVSEREETQFGSSATPSRHGRTLARRAALRHPCSALRPAGCDLIADRVAWPRWAAGPAPYARSAAPRGPASATPSLCFFQTTLRSLDHIGGSSTPLTPTRNVYDAALRRSTADAEGSTGDGGREERVMRWGSLLWRRFCSSYHPPAVLKCREEPTCRPPASRSYRWA